ncbi:hypothetical protein MRB53_006257 [Persea americana]|uniref:Uncharacterized protein n=1 Tax=Persea americana TaxID=3435 RepID=A0ACC2MFV5_PERAE|nr:hypothetical protein MRB53_006257 [Persea americana]
MQTYLSALGYDIWDCVRKGYKGKEEPTDVAEKKLFENDSRARNALLCGLSNSELVKVMNWISYSIEMRIGKTKPTEKEAASKAHKKNKQVAQSDEEDLDDELTANFVRKLRKGKGKFKGKLPFKCFNCGGIGHFAAKCPLANADEDDSDSYKSKKDYSRKSYVKKGKSKSYISKRTESCSENSSNENSEESNEVLFMAVLDDEKEKEKSNNEEIETEINLEEELIAALEQLS